MTTKTTVTLSGISEHFTADELECLVRTAAEAVCGDRDSDSLSEKQMRLATRAYELLIAEMEAGPPLPDFGSRGDKDGDDEFYSEVFADHARRHGVQTTWAAFYAQFRAGKLLIDESVLFGYLGAFMAGQDRFDREAAELEPCGLASVEVSELRDGEVFSLDEGATWHACGFVLAAAVSCYLGAARTDDDAIMYRVDAPCEAMCWVVVRRRHGRPDQKPALTTRKTDTV